jgi:ABC-type multidrug transport system fused ATPase/permease subunit
MSGGEKQLSALASILINPPQILILDDPFSMIDFHYKELIKKIVFTQNCFTVLSFLNRLDNFQDYDYVLFLDKGKQIFFGKPLELFEHNLAQLVDCGLDIPTDIIKILAEKNNIEID